MGHCGGGASGPGDVDVSENNCQEGYSPDANGFCTEDIIIDSPDDPIEDLEEFLECLDRTQGAIVTISAKQPDPNNPNSDYTNENLVGHAFITISQGQYRLSYGFYPEEGVGYFNPTTGIMGRNGDYPLHVSVSNTISADILNNLISVSLSWSSAEYELQVQNCTNFAINASRVIGLNIIESECEGNYGVGSGVTPGKFGAYLKNMTLPTGATRNIGSATSPSNKECN